MADGADVLVIGGGPAALCIASELHQRGVLVEGIAPNSVDAPWPNTYGIWAKELELLGLEDLLEHRWSNTVSFYGAGGSDLDDQPTQHWLDYGLFDRHKLQQYWLSHSQGMTWHQDSVDRIELEADRTRVQCASGEQRLARVVIDASGHRSPHICRPDQGPVAGQAAYGVVGRFQKAPVEPRPTMFPPRNTPHHQNPLHTKK